MGNWAESGFFRMRNDGAIWGKDIWEIGGSIRGKKLRVQKRDLEILKWVLEMRFASIAMLHNSFFKTESPSMAGARSRIRILEKEGLLTKTPGFDCSSESYYLTSKKGWRLLQSHLPEASLVRPLARIAVQTFHHDKLVALARIRLEAEGRASGWKSERRIKAELAARSISVARDYMPDGIFTSKIGVPCAFEMEISPKTTSRYYQKVQHFVEIMEANDGPFKLCLFVTSTDFTFKTLSELTLPYGNRFRVQRREELLK